MGQADAPSAASKVTLVEWLRSSLLPLAVFAIGAFVTYTHDQAATAKSIADLAKNLDSVSSRLDRDERDTAERVKDLVPIIRGNEIAQKQSELIDRAQSDRIEAMAQSIIQLRQVVESLSKSVSETHEDLKVYEAGRRREGRLIPPMDRSAPLGGQGEADRGR